MRISVPLRTNKAHDCLEQYLYKAKPRLHGIMPSMFSFRKISWRETIDLMKKDIDLEEV